MRRIITLLLTAGLLTACGTPSAPSTEPVRLLASSLVHHDTAPWDFTRLTALDPATLHDRTDVPPIDLPAQGWISSADGTTIFSWEQHGRPMTGADVTIHVFDTRTGAEKARFHPPSATAGFAGTSSDGRRLALVVNGTEWDVLDADSGQVLRRTASTAGAGWTAAIDANLDHTYRVLTGTTADAGPQPLQLVDLDLRSGEESRPVALPDVLTGTWSDPQRKGVGSEPLFHQLMPGVALSPDGRLLAFAHADTDAVTIVDAHDLQPLRTVSLHRRPGIVSWFVSVAHAKGWPDGVRKQARFSPDGRRVYIWGEQTAAGDNPEHPTITGLGLQVVDTGDGTVLAEGLPGARVAWLATTSDGRQWYALVDPETHPPEPGVTFDLYRLDGETLQVLAERPAFSQRQLLLDSRA